MITRMVCTQQSPAGVRRLVGGLTTLLVVAAVAVGCDAGGWGFSVRNDSPDAYIVQAQYMEHVQVILVGPYQDGLSVQNHGALPANTVVAVFTPTCSLVGKVPIDRDGEGVFVDSSSHASVQATYERRKA